MRSSRNQTVYVTGLTLVLIVAQSTSAGDEALPVVRANSTKADVQDGGRRVAWYLDDVTEVHLDVYYARRGQGDRKVTFRTDVDTITFDVRPGRNYDFVVLFDGKHRCRSRISTLRETCREAAPRRPGGAGHPLHDRRDTKSILPGGSTIPRRSICCSIWVLTPSVVSLPHGRKTRPSRLMAR